jgi:hypothetical protein
MLRIKIENNSIPWLPQFKGFYKQVLMVAGCNYCSSPSGALQGHISQWKAQTGLLWLLPVVSIKTGRPPAPVQ